MNIRFDRKFIKHTMMIALPIMLQNGITNFVSMLDNIMVGRVGTDPMTGVSIVNSLVFVWNLCLFGGLSGIGIFTAQYCGKKDHDGVRQTFRLQVMLSGILVAAGIAVFAVFGRPLINMYLHEDGGGGSAAATMQNALAYLRVMCVGFLPFAFTQVYGTTVRSHRETVAPMVASFIAVAVNLTGNYILIYGKFGAPALGVVGAALATVISRFVEMLYIMIWTHMHGERLPFIRGAFSSFHVSKELTLSCISKGFPLLLNETLWSAGQAVLTQCYSIRGLSVVSAFNISQTISNVFNVAFIAMGSATAIIIGQRLGELGEEHREELDLIRISAMFMPAYAFLNASYFIIRSGGKTFITFLFDSCYCWAVSIPVAYFLAHYTGIPILPMFAIVQGVELIKVAIGAVLVNKGIWIRDITV